MLHPHLLRLALLSAIVAIIGAALAAAPPALAASGSASPSQATPGARVNFTGTGFLPKERVDFWVTSPTSVTYPRYPSVVADASGSVVWSWDLDATATTGTWIAVARGIRSDIRLAIPFEVVGNPAAPPAPAQATPPSGPRGTTFSFFASGFTADEKIAAWLVGPDGRDRDLVPGVDPGLNADGKGELRWSWAAPDDALLGQWRTIARGRDSNVERVLTFTVTGTELPQPTAGVSPASGPPGTAFTFFVEGLSAGEELGTWLIAPSGERRDATPYLRASDAGRADWSWLAPGDAQGGEWQMVVRSKLTTYEAIIRFTVTGNNPPPASPGAQGGVTPPSGPAGSTFRFTVGGMAPNETVYYWATAPDGKPVPNGVTAQAFPNGQATWDYTISDLAQAGTWIMTARGAQSDRTVQISFIVTAGANPVTAVLPPSGPAGTTFSFTARGFRGKEELDAWASNPDGVAVPVLGKFKADENGTGRWQWTPPAGTKPGPWVMVVRGRKDERILEIPFTITP